MKRVICLVLAVVFSAFFIAGSSGAKDVKDVKDPGDQKIIADETVSSVSKTVPVLSLAEKLFGIKATDVTRLPGIMTPKTADCEDDRVISSKAQDFAVTFTPMGGGSESMMTVYGRLKEGREYDSLDTVRDVYNKSFSDDVNHFAKDFPLFDIQMGSNKLLIFFPSAIPTSPEVTVLLESFLFKPICEVLPGRDADERGELFRCSSIVDLTGGMGELQDSFKESQLQIFLSAAKIGDIDSILCNYLPEKLGPLVTAGAVDKDEDSVPDNWDNCPDVKNRSQEDSDGNGVGDACQTARVCEQKLVALSPGIETAVQSDSAADSFEGSGSGCSLIIP